MLISTIIIGLLVFCITQAKLCPSCLNNCGSVGFSSCEGCQCQPSCENYVCPSEKEECIMQELICDSEPCPQLPTCIDLSAVCAGAPLRSDDEPAVICNTLECPRGYTCTSVVSKSLSICCRNTGHVLGGSMSTSGSMLDAFSNDDDSGGEDGCSDCLFDPCLMLPPCELHPGANCITDDCTCTSWFVDHNARKVDCVAVDGNGANMQPPSGFLPPDFNFNGDDARNASDAASPSDWDAESWIHVTRNESTQSSHERNRTSSWTFETYGTRDDDGGSVTGVAVLTAVVVACVVCVVLLVAVLVYKVYQNRRKTRIKKIQEEQLKPLRLAVAANEEPA